MAASQIKTFTSTAVRSASPIHYQPLNARGNAIYLGGETETYCPKVKDVKCPKGNTTVFDVNNKTKTAGYGPYQAYETASLANAIYSLDTSVPGGQQLYVAPNGALSYTIPHSAAVPEHSYQQGFTVDQGTGLGSWTFEGKGGATGFLACPTEKEGEYQVFADIEGVESEDCLGFDAIITQAKGPGAYQYA